MSNVIDIELDRSEPPPPPVEQRSPAVWIAIAVALLAAIAFAGYWFLIRSAAEPESRAFTESAVPVEEARPLGADAPAIELPPLGQTDSLVRKLVSELSSHPRVAAWLATDGLIRNFTVAVDNIAGGSIPQQALRSLRPTGRFLVIESGPILRIDPKSYERHNPVADAVNSIDPNGAARLYSMLKPRIEEAYGELGTGMPFDRVLETAIASLLRAPVLDGNVGLDPKGGVFAFEDPAIERLPAARKQLTRMGPRNVRIIQARLREIALALGIPAERLTP